MNIGNSLSALSKFEWGLWTISVVVVTSSFLLGGEFYILTLITSLIGVTALIFVAKGDVLGQVLTIIFSLGYSVISWRFHYYGEIITYLGMTAPIAGLSVVSWLKHPYEKEKNVVEVAQLTITQKIKMVALAIVVTAIFYFILKYFNTTNLTISTISVTTSFLASYLMFCRSSAYALAYAMNDIVLIVLWILATLESISFLPMIICFTMFFCNDMYGFVNWQRMSKKQSKEKELQKNID
ncbi:MAG: nicotinamide riboside transporter PnuC [Aminipila sp.]